MGSALSNLSHMFLSRPNSLGLSSGPSVKGPIGGRKEKDLIGTYWWSTIIETDPESADECF